jgi:hypothetical protein
VGLHFWGIIQSHILPNISYPDAGMINQSMNLIKQTIDIAERHQFQYVNIHPGSAALLSVDYKKERYDIYKEPIEMDQSIDLFIESALQLSAYAKQRNIVFTVETVPPRITDGWYDADARMHPKNSFELPVRAIIKAAKSGIAVANDFCHTAANIITDDANQVWTFLHGTTELLAPYTRLIHLGFVMPPYNGSDNHDMFDNPIFMTDQAVPNDHQTIELLQLFVNRDDVWILAEPKDDHVKNYFLVKKLVEQAFQI